MPKLPPIPVQSITRFFIRTLKVLAVCLVLLAGALYWQRGYFLELKKKDEFRFQLLIDEAKQGHLLRAWDVFVQLQGETYMQAFEDRYRRRKERMAVDYEFRQNILFERKNNHQKWSEERRKVHEAEMEFLLETQKTSKDAIRNRWDAANTWQKGLILREKCIRYIELEQADRRKRRRLEELPKRGALITHPRISGLTPAEFCEDRVPISHDPQKIQESMQDLRDGMNYYYYVRLLDELGMKASEVFEFPAKLDRMTEDFNDI